MLSQNRLLTDNHSMIFTITKLYDVRIFNLIFARTRSSRNLL
jgi:hypothetical protein